MKYRQTTAVNKINAMKKRLKIIQGGSSAGKTIAILLIFIDIAQRRKNLVLSVVSETMPHLRRGAMRDFLNIMEGHGYYQEANWDKTNSIYTFETGCKIEFFSVDSPSKVRGPRRHHLFMNECNNIPFDAYTQLAIRTEGDIYLDYNPTAEFWVHSEIIQKEMDHDFVIVTYKDNEGLPASIVKEIESRKDDKYFWTVFGLGQLGEIEGRIYKEWKIIDDIPHEARLISKGLDFGYTNDPTGLCDIYYYNGGYIIDELAYQTGLLNKQISDVIKRSTTAPTIADSAEPKSIDELRLYGLTVLPATKGKGSLSQGIAFVQQQRISITKRSVNFIKEYRNYMWRKDSNGSFTDEPEHAFSHGMDAIRYGLQIKQNLNPQKPYVQPKYETPLQGNYETTNDFSVQPISSVDMKGRYASWQQPAWESPMADESNQGSIMNNLDSVGRPSLHDI